MYQQAYQQYRQVQTVTADPAELVVMLYQGAIKFLVRAKLAIDSGDLQTANASIVRAEEIITELNSSLDTSVADVAANLAKIYDYAYWRLVEANCHKDATKVDEILRILRELLPAWQEAARVSRQARPSTTGAAAGLSLVGAR